MADHMLLPLATVGAGHERRVVSFAAMVHTDPKIRRCNSATMDFMLQVFVTDHTLARPDDRLVVFFAPTEKELPVLRRGDIALFHEFTVVKYQHKIQFRSGRPPQCYVFDTVGDKWVERVGRVEPIDSVTKALDDMAIGMGIKSAATGSGAPPALLFKAPADHGHGHASCTSQAPTLRPEPAFVHGAKDKASTLTEPAGPSVKDLSADETPRLLREISDTCSSTVVVQICGVKSMDVANRETTFFVTDYDSQGLSELQLHGADADFVKRPPGDWLIRVPSVRMVKQLSSGGCVIARNVSVEGGITVVAPESVDGKLHAHRKAIFKSERQSSSTGNVVDRLLKKSLQDAAHFDDSEKNAHVGGNLVADAIVSTAPQFGAALKEGGSEDAHANDENVMPTLEEPESADDACGLLFPVLSTANSRSSLAGDLADANLSSVTSSAAGSSQSDSALESDAETGMDAALQPDSLQCLKNENGLSVDASSQPLKVIEGTAALTPCNGDAVKFRVLPAKDVCPVLECAPISGGLATGHDLPCRHVPHRKRDVDALVVRETSAAKQRRALEMSLDATHVPFVSISNALSAPPGAFAVRACLAMMPNIYNAEEIVKRVCKACDTRSEGLVCSCCGGDGFAWRYDFCMALRDDSTARTLDVIVSGADACLFLDVTNTVDMMDAENHLMLVKDAFKRIARGLHVFVVDGVSIDGGTAFYLRGTLAC